VQNKQYELQKLLLNEQKFFCFFFTSCFLVKILVFFFLNKTDLFEKQHCIMFLMRYFVINTMEKNVFANIILVFFKYVCYSNFHLLHIFCYAVLLNKC